MPRSAHVQKRAYERRWWILAVLCVSLFVIVLDNSILNVALPTLVRDLDASNSQLQWIVDAYTLVFAGLLLTAGSLGDRFGRRGALQFGFALFGIGSALSALASSPNQLIATRAFMGMGGAFIMPATLSIITNVFPAKERGKAIGIWAAAAGLGVLGPLVGGFLLEHFYWGSVFLVNLPVVVAGLLAGVFLIPTSKDPNPRRLDPIGALLSITGLVALLYGIIQAPENGWTDPGILAAFAIGGVLLLAFLTWEAHSSHPMLDVGLFRNPRFSAASGAISMTFFAMFGSLFLLTQYFQFVLGYTPLETGIRMLPWAVVMIAVSPNAPRLAHRFGSKAVVTTGLSLIALGLVTMSFLTAESSYADIIWRIAIMALGMSLTMAPATESIMGSLPLAKAGVGSAVNDTTRQVGGAMGVAIVGSVASSIYSSRIGDAIAGTPSAPPPGIINEIENSLGFALQFAARLGGPAGEALANAARTGFVDGMQPALLVAAGAALLGAVFALAWLPARARQQDVDAQTAAYAAARRETVPAPTPAPVIEGAAANDGEREREPARISWRAPA
jgi:EmrB/QacA subfamily drug resistance transporter